MAKVEEFGHTPDIHSVVSEHMKVVCQLTNHRRRLDYFVKLEVDAEDHYRIKDKE